MYACLRGLISPHRTTERTMPRCGAVQPGGSLDLYNSEINVVIKVRKAKRFMLAALTLFSFPLKVPVVT